MAMSGGANKRVGSTGEIRVHAQVISQDASRNESIVRVRGFMRATEGSSTSHGTADMSTSATSGGTRNWPGRSFSVQGQSWTEVVSNDHTVPHRADGTRPLTATFTLGPTGTSRFGSGGTVSVSFNIDRIPQVPSKPSRPSLSNITATGVRAAWSAPANNGAAIDDYQVRVERGGSTVDSANTGTVRNHTFGGLDANTQYGVRVRARNSAGWGPYSDFRYFDTKVASPTAPNNISASRVNDGHVNIGWSRQATSAAPYVSQRVLRREYTGTQWSNFANIATVSGSASSFSDTTTAANGQYQYRVQAVNASGSATSSISSSVRTTPGVPTIGQARKLSNGDIEVTYTPTVPYEDHIQHELQDNPGGTGWVTVATVVGSVPLKHENPDPTKTHQYRVRTVDTYSSPNLAGAWSAVSNVVQLLAPPLAPSLVGPSGAVDRDQVVRLEYQHNPVDTTDQTAGEVRWRAAGGTWTTVSTGTNNFYDLPAPGTSGVFEWQARTRGEHATYGPWSPTWSFNAVSRPEVVIQSPEATLDQSQAEVVWGYQNADSSGQSRWEAQLLDAEDNVLATGSGSNTATAYLFPTVLDDATEYTVRVRVRASTGLWSEWDTVTFTTDFPLPAEVGVLAEWDRETGSVAVSFGPNKWVTYGWDGTPNDSPSTRTDEDGTVTNVFENPDMAATDGDVVVFENLATPDWRGDPDLTEVENSDGTFTYTGIPVSGTAWVGGGVLIQSTQWSKTGGVSARFITTDSHENTFASAVVAGGRDVGGVAVWRYQDSPIGEVALPEPLEALSNLMLLDAFGSHVSAPAENVPGETLMRIYFEETDPNLFVVHLPGGANVGDSVWYDLLTITDDLYSGEPFSGSTQSTIEAETLDVQRDDGDGWITIATGLDPETSIVDHTPRLATVRYRTISRTDLPTARTGPETVIEPPRGLWPVFLNGGPDMGDVIAIYDNTQLAFDRERAKTRRVWAGRDWPTTKWGQARSKTVALTATISPESPGATMPEIEALEDIPSVVCVRDILGHKIFVTIDSVSADVERDGRWNVSIPMTREHYIEGVR